MNNKLLTYLGFALKSGICTKGSENVVKDVRQHKADLVVVDATCTNNTKKMVFNACQHYQVQVIEVESDILYTLTQGAFKVLSLKKSPLTEQIKQLSTGGK